MGTDLQTISATANEGAAIGAGDQQTRHRDEGGTAAQSPARHFPDRVRPLLPIAFVGAVYLAITILYSIWIPAWESNDEDAHVQYIEYIVKNGRIPRIGSENGHESQQPPLYYLVGSLWQHILRIPFFTPDPNLLTGEAAKIPQEKRLILSHDYNAAERRHAIAVHELRILSICLGLATVLSTYAAAKIVTRRTGAAASATLFVALLPKFNVICATVTNDALVVALCAFALVEVLLYLREIPRNGSQYRCLAVALGITLGAAFLAKFNCAPVIPVLILAILLARTPLRSRLLDIGLAGGGALSVSAWWLLRTHHLYGEYLGRKAATDYLNTWLPGLIAPVPWTDTERFLNFVPNTLIRSVWYDGDWNQFSAPFMVNLLLSFLAAIAIFGALRSFFFLRGRLLSWRIGGVLFLSTLAAVGAVAIIAKDTTQAEGRYTYVALSAFAILAVIGLEEASGDSSTIRRIALVTWPVVLLLFNLYIIARFILPFRHL